MNLKKYLRNMDDERFYELNKIYEEYYGLEDGEDEIDVLYNTMINNLPSFIESINFDQIVLINDIIKNGITDDVDDYFFEFGLIDFDGYGNSIMPTEVLDFFKKEINKDLIMDLLITYLNVYFQFNMVIPFEFIEYNYIKRFNLDVKLDDVVDTLVKSNDGELYDIIDNYVYCTNLSAEVAKKLCEELPYPIKFLNEDQYIRTRILHKKLFEELESNRFNLDEISAFINVVSPFYIQTNAFKEQLKSEITLPNNKVKKLEKIYNKYHEDIRHYITGGRTLDEELQAALFYNPIKYKKNMSLRDCLSSINKDVLNYLYVRYGTRDLDELYDKITENFNALLDSECGDDCKCNHGYFFDDDCCCGENNSYLEFISLLCLNGDEISEEDVDIDLFSAGFAFVGEKKNHNKVLIIPSEFIIEY